MIDLTKSKRFYDKREIELHGCMHLKIACKGNEECPTEEQVKLFIEVVKRFENSNSDGDRKIVVHCTHGFNRTGFLIISYLFEEYDIEYVRSYFQKANKCIAIFLWLNSANLYIVTGSSLFIGR